MPYGMVNDLLLPSSFAAAGGLVFSLLARQLKSQCPCSNIFSALTFMKEHRDFLRGMISQRDAEG